MSVEVVCSNDVGPRTLCRLGCYPDAAVIHTVDEPLSPSFASLSPWSDIHSIFEKWSLDDGSPNPTLELASGVPVPPPISAELRWSEDDSGHGSAADLQLVCLPYCDLSDDEFTEVFLSRGGSNCASDIPNPPPPPPLPSYLRHLQQPPSVSGANNASNIPSPPPPPPLPAYLRHLTSVSGATLISELDVESQVHDVEHPFGLYDFESDYEEEENMCIVCYASGHEVYGIISQRDCCGKRVCKECVASIVLAKIEDGIVYMQCPNPGCNAPIARTEILDCLTAQHKERYERMRLEADGDETKKACPNCCHITEHKLPTHYFRKFRIEDVQIHCEKCSHMWCFKCHAPWHTGLSCAKFRRGDTQFLKWTKGRTHAGIANCQKCPFCHVYIQRSTGCDHMTCNRCDTEFCYKCGGRLRCIPGLGDHYTRTSVLGCRYNYKADSPVRRKAIRGGYFGAKLAALTGYPFLLVGGVAVIVVAGAVVLPVYVGYKLYKIRKNTNRLYGRRRRH